jgi:hypothetical protein
MELRECQLCSELAPNVWFRIHTYNGVLICNQCTEFGIFSEKPIVVLNEMKCPVCFETKKGIQMPNCSHFTCIDCCKRIYYGYVADAALQYPLRYRRQHSLPVFPYDDSYKEYEWAVWENYNYHKNIKWILQDREKSKATRPKWMNTEVFLQYEIDYINYWVEQFQLDEEEDKWRQYRQSNIRNANCPLCRK